MRLYHVALLAVFALTNALATEEFHTSTKTTPSIVSPTPNTIDTDKMPEEALNLAMRSLEDWFRTKHEHDERVQQMLRALPTIMADWAVLKRSVVLPESTTAHAEDATRSQLVE